MEGTPECGPRLPLGCMCRLDGQSPSLLHGGLHHRATGALNATGRRGAGRAWGEATVERCSPVIAASSPDAYIDMLTPPNPNAVMVCLHFLTPSPPGPSRMSLGRRAGQSFNGHRPTSNRFGGMFLYGIF